MYHKCTLLIPKGIQKRRKILKFYFLMRVTVTVSLVEKFEQIYILKVDTV